MWVWFKLIAAVDVSPVDYPNAIKNKLKIVPKIKYNSVSKKEINMNDFYITDKSILKLSKISNNAKSFFNTFTGK